MHRNEMLGQSKTRDWFVDTLIRLSDSNDATIPPDPRGFMTLDTTPEERELMRRVYEDWQRRNSTD